MLYDKDGWKIQVDVEKTALEYERLQSSSPPVYCPCLLCVNINEVHRRNLLPEYVKNIARDFGINHEYPGEFYAAGSSPNLYHGFFSFYGCIISEKKPGYSQYWFEDITQLGTPGFTPILGAPNNGECLLGVSIDISDIEISI